MAEEGLEGARWIQLQWIVWGQWSESTDDCWLPGPLKTRLLATFLDAGGLVRRGLAGSCVVAMAARFVLGDTALAAETSLLASVEQLGGNLLDHSVRGVATRSAMLTAGWTSTNSGALRSEGGKELRHLFTGDGRGL